jgi:SAM-dependent methyltransferase
MHSTSAELTDRLYSSYAATRPRRSAPTCASDLLAGREPTFRKRLAPLLPSNKHARILDAGCGYGEFLYFLRQEGYTETVGVDLDPEQVETAQRLGLENVHGADVMDFLLSAGQFDFISALDVLEHFPKPCVLELLDRVRNALRPGGRFLCQVPNLAAFHTPVFFMDFTHETPFTASSLKQALELAHFTNVTVYPMGPVAHGLKSTVRLALWKAIQLGLRVVQTIEGGPRDRLSSIFTTAIYATAEKGMRPQSRLAGCGKTARKAVIPSEARNLALRMKEMRDFSSPAAPPFDFARGG